PGRRRVDVHEGHRAVVGVDRLARDRPGDDAAEQAVGIRHAIATLSKKRAARLRPDHSLVDNSDGEGLGVTDSTELPGTLERFRAITDLPGERLGAELLEQPSH